MNPYAELIKEHITTLINLFIYITTTVGIIGAALLLLTFTNDYTPIKQFDTVAFFTQDKTQTLQYTFTLNKQGKYIINANNYLPSTNTFIYPTTPCKLFSYSITSDDPNVKIMSNKRYDGKSPQRLTILMKKAGSHLSTITLTLTYTCRQHIHVLQTMGNSKNVRSNCMWKQEEGVVQFFCKTQPTTKDLIAAQIFTALAKVKNVVDPYTVFIEIPKYVLIALVIIPTLITMFNAFVKGFLKRDKAFIDAVLWCTTPKKAYDVLKTLKGVPTYNLTKQDVEFVKILKTQEKEEVITFLKQRKAQLRKDVKKWKQALYEKVMGTVIALFWISFAGIMVSTIPFVLIAPHNTSWLINTATQLPVLTPLFSTLLPYLIPLMLITSVMSVFAYAFVTYERVLSFLTHHLPALKNFFGDSLGDLIPNEYKLALMWACVRYKVFKE